MKVVLFLANQPETTCAAKAQELIPEQFDKVMVFQSELKLREEVSRDNHVFVACVVEKGKTLDGTTRNMLSTNYIDSTLLSDVVF